jgi:hypothetical protein
MVPVDLQLYILDICKRGQSSNILGKLRLVCRTFSRYVSFDDMDFAMRKKICQATLEFVLGETWRRKYFVEKMLPMLSSNVIVKLHLHLYSYGVLSIISVLQFKGPLEENVTREMLRKEVTNSLSTKYMPSCFNNTIIVDGERVWFHLTSLM